jgi:sulfur relay protein TusB/DsrH
MTWLLVFGESPEEAGDLLGIVEEVAQAGEKFMLLLIHEACKSAVDKPFCKEMRRRSVDLYVLGEDLAEGLLGRVIKGVEVVDYDGWVELLEQCDKVFSWT